MRLCVRTISHWNELDINDEKHTRPWAICFSGMDPSPLASYCSGRWVSFSGRRVIRMNAEPMQNHTRSWR